MRLPGLVVFACVLLQMPGVAAAGETFAAWKKVEIDFVYLGFTTRYSCDGLRDKLRVLLAASGARPDFDVANGGCNAPPGQVTEFPRARLAFSVAAIPAPGAREGSEPVIARWQPVQIAHRRPRHIEPGDCELIEQFRDRILPAFTIRKLDGDVNCIPHQLSGSSFNLRYEVLEALPAADPQGRKR